MVLPGMAWPHTGPPQPPEGPSSALRKEPQSRENHQQLLLWRERGHSPGTPSPAQPGDATPSSRQGTGDTGTPTGAARAMPGPHGPRAEPGAASSTSSSLGWHHPTGIPRMGLGSPSCHPSGWHSRATKRFCSARLLPAPSSPCSIPGGDGSGETGTAGTGRGQGTRETRNPFPSCRARQGGHPGSQQGLT